MDKLEIYGYENIKKASGVQFISEEVLPVGTLVILKDKKHVTILTKPFNRPHFGLSKWICAGLVNEEIREVYIYHLNYMQNKSFNVLIPGISSRFEKPMHIVRLS